MASKWRALRRAWALKCMAVNAAGSLVDYCVLGLAATVLELPAPVAAMLGVASGAAFSFTFNRWLVFGGAGTTLGRQVLRYAAAIGALMVLHANAVWLLVDGASLPLLVAKVTADLCIFASIQPWVLRRFVFAKPRALPPLLGPEPVSIR